MLSNIFTKLILILIAMMTVLGTQSQAQLYRACLAKAFLKIEPGQKIEILDHDEKSISGHLQKIDLEKSTITIGQAMVQTGRLISQPFTVNGADIAVIKYRQGQKSKEPMIVGLYSGFTLGLIVGMRIFEEKKSDAPFGTSEGIAYIPLSLAAGAGIGALLGAVISALTPAEYVTIECEP